MTRWNGVKAACMAYGNEVTLGLAYGNLCLVVDLPGPGRVGLLEENKRGKFFRNTFDEHKQSESTGPF
ncbi:hypothetical protein C8Q74DRAFT_1248406 [Fomes fomentarius]|nr:hypothetical protein C8Q74DRAFT_1248406 [Fomes fomentarius]